MTTETNRKAVGMKNHTKYSIGYFMPPEASIEWVKKTTQTKHRSAQTRRRNGAGCTDEPRRKAGVLSTAYAISVLRRSKWDSRCVRNRV